MRILVILNSLELGGTQINAVDFAGRLRGRGIESILIGPRATAGEGLSLFDYARDRGVEIEAFDLAPGMAAQARQLRRIADEHDADLVHVCGMWGSARPTYWGPALLGRRPWAQTVYEMSITPVVHRHMPLIVGTEYLVEELADRPGRTVLISPPVDLDSDAPDAAAGRAFRAENDLGDGLLLGIVSRLDSRLKGTAIATAIEAMRTLTLTGATLYVVGGGDAASALTARADAVNRDAGRAVVRMLGPRSDARPAYAAADIVLGMGGSAARALAFGRPLIVHGEAGWSCLFEESSAAMLARSSFWSPERPEDPVGDLVRIAEPLIADPARWEDLGGFGRRFAQQRFGLDAMTDRLAAFYAEAVGAYRAGEWLRDLPREGRRVGGMLRRRLGLVRRLAAGSRT
ncbi:glycosyltransferase family 4 protein [Microbacterium sp. 2MCAF23]|uniref:glycosyltransferase family 4 protein n=1 Tax=Microbacterium sp. 2MCAF23 TaxID=3232985 RepID=UPI003F960FF0